MRFTLRQLAAFGAVARTSHFGNAADLLQISQPTVSSDIKALEKALKVTLFHRSRSGTELSDAGLDLLGAAQKVLDAAQELDRAARRFRAEGAPPVRLAASPSLVNRLVPSMLHVLSGDSDAPPVEVVEVPTGGVSRAVAAGDADVGIGHFVEEPHGCASTTLGFDRLWVLANHGALVDGEPADLRTMGGRQLLVWPRKQNPEYFDFLLDVCHQHGLSPLAREEPVRISGSYSYLITSGEAFALVPEDFAREAPASLSYAPLNPPARMPLQAVWRTPPVSGAGQVLTVLRDAQYRPKPASWQRS